MLNGKDITKFKHYGFLSNLNRRLNSYIYGLYINGVHDPRRNTTAADWDLYLKISSPVDFERRMGGVCWDYVVYQAYYIKNHCPDLEYKTWFVAFMNNDDEPTHTFMTIRIPDAGYMLFESSFKKIKGLYVTSYDEMDLVEYILSLMQQYDTKHIGMKTSPIRVYQYNPLDPAIIGMGCVDFYNYIFKSGKCISDNYKSDLSGALNVHKIS